MVNCVYSLESGDTEPADSTSLKNKIFNDESTPLTTTPLSAKKGGTDVDSDVDSDRTLVTDKMISGNSVPLKESDWSFFPL